MIWDVVVPLFLSGTLLASTIVELISIKQRIRHHEEFMASLARYFDEVRKADHLPPCDN